MSGKPTPGPWTTLPPKIGASITIYAKDGQTPIATTCSNTSPKTMEMHRSGEVKANALLIAAAPELLEELQDILRSIEGGGNIVTFGDVDIARYTALINKATASTTDAGVVG